MRAKLTLCFATAEYRVVIWPVRLMYTPLPAPSVASVAVRSNALDLLLFIQCLLLLPFLVVVAVLFVI